MRVALVGRAGSCAVLRSRLPEGVEVVAEVRTVAEARRVPDVEAYIVAAGAAGGSEDVRREHLTPRELEVLGHLADGLSNKAIAVRLGISDETVKFHLSAVFGKLQASNRTEAVRRALRRGLIDV